MHKFLLICLALPATALAAPTLALDGSCPGPTTIDLSGFTPGGNIAFLMSELGVGDDSIPAGPCAGTTTGLEGPRWLNTLADADGAMTFYPSLPGGACTRHIQMLDVATCTLTGVGDLSTMSVSYGDGGCYVLDDRDYTSFYGSAPRTTS